MVKHCVIIRFPNCLSLKYCLLYFLCIRFTGETGIANRYFEEESKGILTVGKLADFGILNENPRKIEPTEIHDIQVLESIKEGKMVFQTK